MGRGGFGVWADDKSHGRMSVYSIVGLQACEYFDPENDAVDLAGHGEEEMSRQCIHYATRNLQSVIERLAGPGLTGNPAKIVGIITETLQIDKHTPDIH